MGKFIKKKALTPEQYTRANKVMVFMAVSFLLMYAFLVMNNSVSSLVLVFPALVGFMIYLNSNVVAIGCFSAFLICAIRCSMFKSAGNIEWYNIANLITMGFVVCTYGSYKAIGLLIDFSKEDQAVIENEAKKREEDSRSVRTYSLFTKPINDDRLLIYQDFNM